MNWYDSMAVELPEASLGNVSIRRLEVGKTDSTLSYLGGSQMGRGVPEGTYTGLYRGKTLWMSDTPDERRDHSEIVHQATSRRARRVLINGLGLGMIVNALLEMDHVRQIDVVEIDPEVVELVGPTYVARAAERGKEVTIHTADAYAITWPKGVRWDVVWSDIWPDLCEDNLPKMTVLKRKYARRCDWHGCWGQEWLRAHRRRTANAWWR